MKCPSCSFEQADDRLDCECCGLIFAKWKERHAPPPEPPPAESEKAGTPGDPPVPAPDPGIELPPEAEIPNRPDDEHLFYNQRRRLYEQIAMLDLQKNNEGDWIYFPWGVFWRGYRVKNLEMKEDIQRFLTLFCCVHSPAVAILGLSAIVLWFYDPDYPSSGWSFFIYYLVFAYSFLWIRTRQWTSRLPVSTRRMNQGQYYFMFFKIFNFKTLFDLEVISLILTLSCLWFWLSEKWRWYLPAENVSILWMCLAFSGSILVLFTHLYYFRKK